MIRRLHDPKHIPKIIAYGRKFHAKTALAGLPFSVKRSEQTLRAAMLSPDQAVWGSFEKNEMKGVLIGAICSYQFFEACYATDLVFIAERDGEKLFRAFCQWAVAHKATTIQMGVTSGLPQAGKFYEHIGMKNLGGTYYINLDSVRGEA